MKNLSSIADGQKTVLFSLSFLHRHFLCIQISYSSITLRATDRIMIFFERGGVHAVVRSHPLSMMKYMLEV